ncbi:sigma-54 interaction domain-containing protein [Acidaminobacter hydrogenoformans]|uniref:Transcriptional regulator containing PAS, AAA-type ATPase, and DNA-binding Fis domains n=1 Tax=Acidaminobacter hydrogenoformans DSM 2784 TaxID=1120920 RepID=A0A1G5S1K0_9FIRM|nr:sigma 54-interacting transcriptional regulator [Acidaminobacter hydrogenoformans]SCZ80183.1 Transcriptional regulator containing PAS, AAA-type ATPase, and DNA-binding Fis domains [Acidaminobacter hydrogenoformans DSM 2784]
MTSKLKVFVFVIYEESVDYYPTILRRIFEDHIDLEVRLYSDLRPVETFSADLVLYTLGFLKPVLVEKCLNPAAEFIHMANTLHGSCLESIKQLNRGTDVLLVSEGTIFLWDTLLTLKAHGMEHVNFVPYYGQRINTSAYKYAIYMGIKTYELPEIDHIIDLGWRVLHPYVLLKIGNAAGLAESFLDEKISNYIKDTTALLNYDDCVEISYLSEFTQERLAIMNLLDTPALLLNDQDVVLGFNERLRTEFQKDFDRMIGQKISRDIFLYQMRSACEDRGGSGSFELSSDQHYKVSARAIESYGQSVHHRVLLEAVPVVKNESQGQLAYKFKDILYESSSMSRIVELARHFSATDTTILIEGPSGVGKELLAHSIHEASSRRQRPFHAVNCGAFSESLLESELFGYASGAFTGALRSGKKGLLESAHSGTIFLDEIGEASLKLQVKLLRFLQEKEVQPIGSSSVRKVDVRVICATNRNLEVAMQTGDFREDLYYRISTVTLSVPPLSERIEDIEPILMDALGQYTNHLSEPLKKFFVNYPWPGNVRELKGCAEYMLSFDSRILEVKHLPDKYQKWLHGHSESETLESELSNYIKERPTLMANFHGVVHHEEDESEMDLEDLVLLEIDHGYSGRRKLLTRLRDRGLRVTEYKINGILDTLKMTGFIQVVKGRGGTRLTLAGKEKLLLAGRKLK